MIPTSPQYIWRRYSQGFAEQPRNKLAEHVVDFSEDGWLRMDWIEETYRTFEINLFEWASVRYEALSFGWGYRAWAMGLIELGLTRSV